MVSIKPGLNDIPAGHLRRFINLVKSVIALLPLLFVFWLEAVAGKFPCPDEQSRELLYKVQELNSVHPLSDAESGYARVIEQASRRAMDDLPLRTACWNLASRTFRTNCSDYGYKCPHPGSDLMEWPAQINDSIPELRANVPALESCPDAYIRTDPKLPIVRYAPVISDEVIDEKITGWVLLTLDVDEFGKVANAHVASSTSSRLEAPAIEATRKFRYQKELVGNRYVPVTGVAATVYFSYWLLAEAAGCSINDE